MADSLKRSGRKRNHSPPDVSDSDTVADLNLRRSDSMPSVSGGPSGTIKRRKDKADSAVACTASAPVLGTAASAASRPVYAEGQSAAAVSTR